MSDFTGMFDDGSDLDARLEAASHLLKQAADEEGVDLNQFSEEELGSMIGNLADDDDDDGGGYEDKTASDITVADVSLELHKRAAYEDFDLTQLHPEEYSELFDKVAAELTDPYIAEENQKWAAQAMNMDELGRIAARGFVDEINKVAAEEERGHRRRGDDDDEDEIDVKVKKAAWMLKQAATPMMPARRLGVGEGLTEAAQSAGKWIRGKANAGFESLGNRAVDKAYGEKGFHKNLRLEERLRHGRRRAAVYGGSTAGVGGAAYGGKKLHDNYSDRKSRKGRGR